jgi:hypothetical protein
VTAAVEAAPRDLILSIMDTDPSVSVIDTPLLAWLVAPGTASVPVTLDRVSAQWAHCTIHPPSSPAELIGGSNVKIDVYVPDTWRGSFSEFLTWIVEKTGKPVNGTKLITGVLKERFGHWVAG